jgi:hypothetical protein
MRSATSSRPTTWMWLLALASALTVAACHATPQTTSPAPSHRSLGSGQPSASGSPVPVTTSTCPPNAQLGGSDALPERQGAGDGATLWALFFPTQPVLTAGQEIKVVWRMTGSGDFSISAAGPDGAVVKPAWGPEPHSSSTWTRPGDEWGTGWIFPAAGCWTIRAKRTSGSGYLVLRVAE